MSDDVRIFGMAVVWMPVAQMATARREVQADVHTSNGFSFHPHAVPSADTFSACIFSVLVCVLTVITCAACKRTLSMPSEGKRIV